MRELASGNQHALGNTWNIGRVDVYNPITKIHKRIFQDELQDYLNNGFIRGIPDDDKRKHPAIKHCTEDNLVGVCYDKQNNKWRSYIHYNNKRYGNKLFDNIHDAILYRWDLENMIKTKFSQ